MQTEITDKLQSIFGFNTFRPGQQQVIESIISGRSATAIFPTGSGKSLCYQLSALCLPHLTIVVSPLIALMNDQLDFLHSKHIKATKIDSSLSPAQLTNIQNELKAGQYKLLYISVERFKNERFREFLKQLSISLLVIDEAHCISEWGHNFRPDYLKLPEFKAFYHIKQVLLLTATATPKVINDMCSKFNIETKDVVITGFYRKNLHLTITPIAKDKKLPYLGQYFQTKKGESSIIYVTLQKTAEDTASYLRHLGINAHFYHAGMKSDERETIQHQFMSGTIDCIVATIAFGMGIDKKDIRHVIHADLPKSIESYSQEIGRAGRDGNTSHCEVLANLDDINILENFIYGDTPEQSAIQSVLEQINQKAPLWAFKMYDLSQQTNIRQLPLKTLLVYLELEGIISPSFSYYEQYRFKELIPTAEITNRFKDERQNFIQAIFSHSDKARLWYTVNFQNITLKYNTDRKRIIAALEYLDEQNLIELEAKNLTEQFTVIKPINSPIQLAEKLFLKFKQKEEGEVNRIHEMIRLFSSDKCLTLQLSTYFGEAHTWTKCNHCSVCAGEVALLNIPSESHVNIEEIASWLSAFKQLLKNEPSLELQTRFLCGISTPHFTKVKARKLDGFAKLENVRYAEVMNIVEELTI